ncbi:hypothetical protein CFY87_05775 [Actinobacillus seminis]|uniref:Uncharacterized protein n=1 Tax=Actinobacillus seminis TaxID=722 RepID=A0A263HBL3_9PAST|nr:hypothetical protein [Actinobacillus seminis]OZN24844.1 hypothetical protein CFY87_05775 [Actinobacillus seminis]SUU36775.1 Uncharacterised protein [Actinobacillus seminis]
MGILEKIEEQDDPILKEYLLELVRLAKQISTLIESVADEMNTTLLEAIKLAENLSVENETTFLVKYAEYAGLYRLLNTLRLLDNPNAEYFPPLELPKLMEMVKNKQGIH